MVALKDDNYNRHIVKNNLFAPVVDAFFDNQGRYNLLDSAVIELFEFIKTVSRVKYQDGEKSSARR